MEYHPSGLLFYFGLPIYSNAGLKWSDGSLESDLPMSRLSELFNINHFIVSQVNPLIAPWIRNHRTKRNEGLFGKIKFIIKSEIKHRIYQVFKS